MINAAVALQAVGLILLFLLATVIVVAGRFYANSLRRHVDLLETKIREMEERTRADAETLSSLRARFPLALDGARTGVVDTRTGVAGAGATSALPNRIVALLTAAAYAAIGKPVVLHYALLLGEDNGASWRESGRHDIFSSHRFR